jgi:hypothetical protein
LLFLSLNQEYIFAVLTLANSEKNNWMLQNTIILPVENYAVTSKFILETTCNLLVN